MISKLLLALALGSTCAAHAACPAPFGAPADFSSALTATLSALEVSQEGERRDVASLGTLKNTSDDCFDGVVVEVRYFDSSHAHVDTAVERLYDVVVPAHGEVAFRLHNPAIKPRQAYAAQEVRVVNAEPKYSRHKSPPSLKSTLLDLLSSWGPMILLISVWIFFMRRMRGKDSPQERSIALLQQQVEFSKAQARSLEQIAASVEAALSARRES